MSIKFTPRGVKIRGKFNKPQAKELVKTVFKKKFPAENEPQMITGEEAITARSENGDEVSAEMDDTGLFIRGEYDKEFFLPLLPLIGMAAQAAPSIMEMFKKKPKAPQIKAGEQAGMEGSVVPGKTKGQLMSAISLLGDLLGKTQADIDGVLDAIVEYDDEDLENMKKEFAKLLCGR